MALHNSQKFPYFFALLSLYVCLNEYTLLLNTKESELLAGGGLRINKLTVEREEQAVLLKVI